MRLQIKEGEQMKAKSHYSSLVAETVARGSLTMFAMIIVFLTGFIMWSGVSFLNALFQFIE